MVPRFLTYGLLSCIATGAVILNAASKHQNQYFPTAMYLMQSKFTRVVFFNDAMLLLVLFGKLIKSLFFGSLRGNEVERLYEYSVVAIIETALALNVFHEELEASVFATFVLILFIKIFHWISRMRIDFIEQTPTTQISSFVRLYVILTLMVSTDLLLVYRYVSQLFTEGPSVALLFATECLILACVAISTLLRLTFHLINLYRHNGWPNKGTYTFYLEILNDLVQCFIYILFFGVIFFFYGLPLHLIRDLYIRVVSFNRRILDFVRYRKIVSELDTRFPNATAEDLARGNNVCVVCLEDMVAEAGVKKLDCGHMFHRHCLRSWLAQKQSCPTCREPISPASRHAPQQQQQQFPQQFPHPHPPHQQQQHQHMHVHPTPPPPLPPYQQQQQQQQRPGSIPTMHMHIGPGIATIAPFAQFPLASPIPPPPAGTTQPEIVRAYARYVEQIHNATGKYLEELLRAYSLILATPPPPPSQQQQQQANSKPSSTEPTTDTVTAIAEQQEPATSAPPASSSSSSPSSSEEAAASTSAPSTNAED